MRDVESSVSAFGHHFAVVSSQFYCRENSRTLRMLSRILRTSFQSPDFLKSPDSLRAQRSDAQLAPDERRHLSPEDFYGVQHFFVWQRRNTHLERNAGDASKNFVHVKDLFRDRFSIADQQRAGRSAQGVKLSACSGRPASFLADFGKSVRIAWKEYFCGFVRGVREKADGMKAYGELLGRMTGAAASLAIEVYKRPKASGLTPDDGNHERKSEHSCANERFGRATDTDPYGERILQRARVDGLAGKRRAVFAGPAHSGAFPDFQEKLEFFRKERIVIFKMQPEEGIRLNERTATGDNFGAASRDQVESGELLKNTNGVGGAKNRDCAGETDILRARGGSGEDHNGS